MQNKKEIGKFITFEGIDGSGKSTQIAMLKKYFLKQNLKKIIFTREPGGVPEAEFLRNNFLNNKKISFLKESEILILLAARNEHYKKLIKPTLENKMTVICDRFTHSTYAYQCYNNKYLEDFYNKFSKILFNNFIPDLVILLDIDPRIANTRIVNRTEKNFLDLKKLDFFQKVRAKYLEMAKKNKKIKVLDANKNESILFTEIKIIIEKELDM